MLYRTSFDRSGSQEFYYVPFFIFLVVVFSLCKIVKPFFDSNPAAVVSIVTTNGIGGLIVWAFIFRDAFRSDAGGLLQNLPGCWYFGQSPECFKVLINLAPDLGCNTQDLYRPACTQGVTINGIIPTF